jgi:hypothetical protein
VSDPTPQPSSGSKNDLAWLGYVLGGLSFIPCLGVLFGLAAIIFGALRQMRAVIILGVCGIVFTVLIYGALFYFAFFQRGGVYDGLRRQMAVSMLNSEVKEIEFYKVQHGAYPQKLDDLLPQMKNSFGSIDDPTAMERGGKVKEFYYQLDPSGKFYYLRSVGPDGIPFTDDDILPSLPASDLKNTGLRLDSPQPPNH